MLSPNFDKHPEGILPVVVQDYKSNRVLMLAYTNEAAWKLTLQTNLATYWSRSRKQLWKKGETSGHTQEIKEILIDCDEDALIFKVKQRGGTACHRGYRSCFYRQKKDRYWESIEVPLVDPHKLYQKEK